jgi:DNA methylase
MRRCTTSRKLCPRTSVSAVFCDPPYNLRVSKIGGRGRVRHPEFAFASGEMAPAQFRKFLLATLANGVRVSAEGAVHYVCMDWRHIGDLIDVGRELYGDMLNLVVWNKSNAGQGSFYRSQHELIGVLRDASYEKNLNSAGEPREAAIAATPLLTNQASAEKSLSAPAFLLWRGEPPSPAVQSRESKNPALRRVLFASQTQMLGLIFCDDGRGCPQVEFVTEAGLHLVLGKMVASGRERTRHCC